MRWFRGYDPDTDIQRELRSHLATEAEAQRESGLSPARAERAAHKALGNATRVAEEVRAVWRWTWLETLAQDLRHGFRLLRRSPAFTITAVLSLAIGIGMNTAIFTLVDAILLRDLPVRNPSELVLLAERLSQRDNFSFTSPSLAGLRRNDVLSGLAAFRPWQFRVQIHGESQLVDGESVSGNFFDVLGVPAVLGRTLTPRDDVASAPAPAAVLAYRFWQRQFNADPRILGQTIELQGYPFTIVGVSAPEFYGLDPGKQASISVPLAMQSVIMPGTPLLTSTTARWLRLVGRRNPGISAAQTQANLELRWRQLQAASPGLKKVQASSLEALPGGQGLYDLRRLYSLPLRALMAAVGLVLLIACANLASLLLARATARRQEIGMRLALGASRGRLLRQLLTESLLLSAAGGAAGVALAFVAAPWLVAIMSRGQWNPVALDLRPHAGTLLFTVGLTVATGLLFGLAPALGSTRDHVHGRRRTHFMSALIVGQVSLCLIVLLCAGLLLGSLNKLRHVDAGFRPDHVLLMSIRPSTAGYRGTRTLQLYSDLEHRFSGLPGVRSVTLSMDTPLGGTSYTSTAAPQGSPTDTHQVNVNSVGAHFFTTMGIPLLQGRDLTERDDLNAPNVAVITASAAGELFPGQSPLGRQIQIDRDVMEVVGVARDTRYQSLREAPQPMVYRPYPQMQGVWGELFFGIRTSGDPKQLQTLVRSELHAAAPSVPVSTLGTLDDRIDASLVRERMVSTLATWLGAFALLLAAIGLYGRFAYAVVERTKEIGIRLALGAPRASVVGSMLGQGMALVLLGLAVGLPLALLSLRGIRTLLFGLTTNDPATLFAVTLTIALVAAIAALIPARRAANVDPLIALRYE